MDTIFVLFQDTEDTGPILLGTFGSLKSAIEQAQEDVLDGLANLGELEFDGDGAGVFVSQTNEEGTTFVIMSTTFVP